MITAETAAAAGLGSDLTAETYTIEGLLAAIDRWSGAPAHLEGPR